MRDRRPHRPPIALALLEEEIVERIKETMRAYVTATREQEGERWDDKERMEGGVDALYSLAHKGGLHGRVIGYDTAREEASRLLREETERLMAEAPATIERLDSARRREGRMSTPEDHGSYTEAREALEYGPHILRYLDGEDVEEIA